MRAVLFQPMMMSAGLEGRACFTNWYQSRIAKREVLLIGRKIQGGAEKCIFDPSYCS